MVEPRLHDIETERKLLAYLVSANQIDRSKVANLPRPDNFFAPSHQTVFQTICDMVRDGTGIDWKTLETRIRADGNGARIGTKRAWQDLVESQPTRAPREYADAIINDYVRRRVHEELQRTAEKIASGADAKTILQQFRAIPAQIAAANITETHLKGSDVMEKTTDVIQEFVLGTDKGAIKTGLSSIDRLTGGFGPGEFVTIAGRPGMGKTGLATTIAYNQAERGIKVLFISMEMDLASIGMRILSRVTGINTLRMRQQGGLKQADWDKIAEAGERISSFPILWSTGGTKWIDELERIIELHVVQDGVQIVYIDQLSKIRAEGDVFQRAANCTNRLSALAATLRVPIVLLAQINREAMKTASKFHELHHFKNSGAFEEDSSICLLVNRPTADEVQAGEDERTVWLALAKNRSGKTMNINSLRFDAKRTVFCDMDMEDEGRPCGDIPDDIGMITLVKDDQSPPTSAAPAAPLYSMATQIDLKMATAGKES